MKFVLCLYCFVFTIVSRKSVVIFVLKFAWNWALYKSVFITDNFYFRIDVNKIYTEVCFKMIAFFSSNPISKIFRNIKLYLDLQKKRKNWWTFKFIVFSHVINCIKSFLQMRGQGRCSSWKFPHVRDDVRYQAAFSEVCRTAEVKDMSLGGVFWMKCSNAG